MSTDTNLVANANVAFEGGRGSGQQKNIFFYKMFSANCYAESCGGRRT